MTGKSPTNKTVPSIVQPLTFVQEIEHATRREDAITLLGWFKRITGMPPVMWGSSIIGFGRYRYEYESGRCGESMVTGFSPRKSNLSIYIMPGYKDLSEPLQRLGKHKSGKSCLYINKLADIDMSVLEEIVVHGVEYMQANYKTWKK